MSFKTKLLAAAKEFGERGAEEELSKWPGGGRGASTWLCSVESILIETGDRAGFLYMNVVASEYILRSSGALLAGKSVIFATLRLPSGLDLSHFVELQFVVVWRAAMPLHIKLSERDISHLSLSFKKKYLYQQSGDCLTHKKRNLLNSTRFLRHNIL